MTLPLLDPPSSLPVCVAAAALLVPPHSFVFFQTNVLFFPFHTRARQAQETTTCPCGSGSEYDDCCGALHTSNAAAISAADPEKVMRARFSAYVKNLPEYIVSSTHPESRDFQRKEDPEEARAQLLLDAGDTMKTLTFTRLTMKKTTDGDDKEEKFVTYEVTYRVSAVSGGLMFCSVLFFLRRVA